MLGNRLFACCKCIHLLARFGAHSERDAIPHAAANHSNLTGRRSARANTFKTEVNPKRPRSSKLVAKESLSWEFTQGKSNKKQPLNGVVPKTLTKLRYFNQSVIDRVAASVHNRVLSASFVG